MYPHPHQMYELARQRQEDLLNQAATARLIREARLAGRSPDVPFLAARSIRSRLATGLHALARWIDDRAQNETPPLIQPA